MSHRFFTQVNQCGDGFLVPCPREALSLTSLHVLQVRWGTPQFGPWPPTHKESRPGVKVNIIIAYYSRSGAVVRLLRLAKPAALKRALAPFFSAQHSS